MKPRLLFHCQHSLGLGHLVRTLALARSLASKFDVTVVAGGELPEQLELPSGIELVRLPALALADGGLVSVDDRYSVESAQRARAAVVLDTFRRLRPEVLVVELFPFGRKKLAGELLPLLTEARVAGALVVSSLRDILVRGRSDQAAHDERASLTANELFDVILVHADPGLVRLEETFRPHTPLSVPVEYTGFVVPETPLPEPPAERTGPVVVSAGGGRFGGALLRTAAAMELDVPVRLVAGPFLPDADWDELQGMTRDGVELVRAVPSLAAALVTARASVSQCGYNTALDLLRTRVPALVVPFAAPGEDEQTRRAALLERRGAVRLLAEASLDPVALGEAVSRLLGTTPALPGLQLDGAARSCAILTGLAATRRRGAA